MTPTNKLRFVKRQELDSENSTHEYVAYRPVRVLQQWWEDPQTVLAVLQFGPNGIPIKQHPGEWRDVPLEEEA